MVSQHSSFTRDSLLTIYSFYNTDCSRQRLQLRAANRRLLRPSQRPPTGRPFKALSQRPQHHRILGANRIPQNTTGHVFGRARTRVLYCAPVPRQERRVRKETRRSRRRGLVLRRHHPHRHRRRGGLLGLAQLGRQVWAHSAR